MPTEGSSPRKTTTGSEVQIAASQDREVLQGFLAMHAQYHNHKETMAFSIFGLEGAFFIGLFVFSQWPPYLQKVPNEGIAALFVVVWILFHLALRFQLRNRRIAAILVASYYDALAQQTDLRYSREQFEVYPDHPLGTFIDACLVPLRKLRAADVAAIKLEDGETVRPISVRAFYYHLMKHKAEASASWTKYAYPIDLLTSVGSIFLLVAALTRVLGASPL